MCSAVPLTGASTIAGGEDADSDNSVRAATVPVVRYEDRTGLRVGDETVWAQTYRLLKLSRAQQHGSGDRSAADPNGHHLRRVGDLPVSALLPHLHAGFVEEPHAVQPTAR